MLYTNIFIHRHPTIKWAQRKQRIFIEIALRDIVSQKIDLKQLSINFQGISDKSKYSFNFQLFDLINTQQSKWTKTGYHLLIALKKKDTNKPFWPRLTKNTAKNQYIQIDWAKWVDQDQQKDQGSKGLGDFDPQEMQGFSGNPGGDKGIGKEEDEEGIDDLDKPEQINQDS